MSLKHISKPSAMTKIICTVQLGKDDCLYSDEIVSLGAIFMGGCALLVLNDWSQ